MSGPVLAWLPSWKGGYAIAAVCAVTGVLRVATAPLDLLTGALFVLALGYAGAAAIERGQATARRPAQPPPDRLRVTTRTRDRVGAALAIVAGIVGLVLVFHGRDGDDDTPAAPPPIGRLGG
ncbi:hypothetical protein [Actinomycetospora cinnamomea]|uniref:Uncharacterized protein n=1 Tax=Actinomycetospora cinnamomea TaxID=663609 RepID=A0A2U1EC43_9PSEU|nr:hypothetical protein [Actinomycetospora cinnamomea]PVY97269.1 hypothetical protein C8D89_12511 [Actinomycetospora cinnamomea]